QLHEEGVDRAPGAGLQVLEPAAAFTAGVAHDVLGVADPVAVAVAEGTVTRCLIGASDLEAVTEPHALLQGRRQGEHLERRPRLEARAATMGYVRDEVVVRLVL